MAATQLNSLERIFSRRDLFRGKSLQALIWGVFASLALCLLLVDLFLIAELLETRGRLVDESEALRYSTLFSQEVHAESSAADGVGAGTRCAPSRRPS